MAEPTPEVWESEPSLLAIDPLRNSLDDPLLLREWFLVAWSSELAPGRTVARRILGRNLVLWRSAKSVHCWLDLCIQCGAKLSLGQVRQQGGGTLTCTDETWEYAPSGTCTRITAHHDLAQPAEAHAQRFQVFEAFGAIWVSLSNDPAEIPDFPLAETPGFRVATAGPYRFSTQGTHLIENALDVENLRAVHSDGGVPARIEVEAYEVTDTSKGPEAREIRIWQPSTDATGSAARVTYRYWVAGPLTIGLEKGASQIAGDYRRFGILAQVSPIDAGQCEMRLLMAMNYGQELALDELRALQDLIAEQDCTMVESQHSQRIAVAYRQWLRKIGLSYGTT